MNRISLQKRLDRLKNGESSDKAYDASLIKSMACLRVYDYLCLYPSEWNFLVRSLERPPKRKKWKEVTYAEITLQLEELYLNSADAAARQKFYKLCKILAFPAADYYECKRRNRHAQY